MQLKKVVVIERPEMDNQQLNLPQDIPKPGAQAIRMPWFVYWISYRRRVKALQRISVNTGDIVFLGDSLTQWVDWENEFPNLPVRNFGIAGDTSYGVLSRLHQFKYQKPAKVFLLIGTNDMFTFQRVSMDELLKNIVEILGQIRSASPYTKIYLQSIFPRQIKWADQIRLLNSKIRSLALQSDIVYIDVWPLLEDGAGGLRKELTRDRLHLKDEGKRIWVDCLRPYVEN